MTSWRRPFSSPALETWRSVSWRRWSSALARAAFDNRGGFVVAADIEEAVGLASDYAPEHLCILSPDARRLAGLVRNAGGVFIGDGSPEAIGDYTAGPSHVMP